MAGPSLPMDDRDGVIWYNGALVPWREAKVHVLVHSLHYGNGVFEGARIYNGSVFKLTEHSARLRKSAEMLAYELPYSVADLDAATKLVVKENKLESGYVRPLMLRHACFAARARESFEYAARLRPEDPRPPYHMGRLFLAGEDEAAAEAAFARAVELQPRLVDGLIELAALADRRGDQDTARAHLNGAVATEPGLWVQLAERFPWLAEEEAP